MTETAKSPMLINPRYQVKGSFGIVRGLTVKRLWGLWRSYKKLNLPEIPADAIMSESSVSDSRLTRERAMLSLAFLNSSKGKAFFRAYTDALKTFVTRYHIEIDDYFLGDCLTWSLEVEVFDSSAPNGSREMFGFEILGVQQLENTVNAISSHFGAAVNILNNDDDENYEPYKRYVSLAHYLAVDDKTVTIHFNDFDDDSSEDAFDVLHCVSLDRAPFASAMMVTYRQIKTCMDDVAKTLGVQASRLKSR